ncbi:transketolase [Actinoplanes derwentensis]|uniref:Transketolase n=1 Tax=Actinoplanes derwentensis TaxID=113562 RepID=A0A1H1UW04_9ACTN|nr:transketolase [Actinoplanes derwentensis]GID88893.1 transketolase, N-terminal subunit [Actinoplanes derwentensis]SDS76697.1 transketolase [Actinoplanes derwentensis]
MSARLANAVRRHVLTMTSVGRSSHIGSALSCADILAVLYADVLRVDPANPDWPDRDRFIMSKGHAGAALYAVLAERGFFDPAVLHRHYQNGSYLSGHVSHVGMPGVDLSTGSLGHGLPVGAGLAWRARQMGREWRTYVLLGDGECDEGSVWEAAMFAGHHELGLLVAVVDCNGLQSMGTTEDTLRLEPFAAKWESFGWDVAEIDGHDHDALAATMRVPREAGRARPRCVLARTVKGKGVSFMENQVLWHYRPPSADELERALAEVGTG